MNIEHKYTESVHITSKSDNAATFKTDDLQTHSYLPVRKQDYIMLKEPAVSVLLP